MRLAEIAKPLPIVIASVVVIAGCLVMLRPWKVGSVSGASAAAPSMASPVPVARPDDAAASAVATNLDLLLREQFAALAQLPDHHEAGELARMVISASIPEDFAGLEALARRLGGGYKGTDAEWALSRRWWRALPRSLRPDFAADMSDDQWEDWVDRAGPAEMVRLPEDTRAAVREIDRARVRVETFDSITPQAASSIDSTIREIAKSRGFQNHDSAQIVGHQGQLRYGPSDAGQPQPAPIVVVYISGVTVDDRDFVAAYIFGRREPTGWFPYFVKSLSQHRDTTPIRRQIPFIPAL